MLFGICQSVSIGKCQIAIGKSQWQYAIMGTSAFAHRLKQQAEKLGISLADLARKSDVPYHQIHTWTRRENSVPNANSLKKVSSALGVTDDFLLHGTPLPEDHSTVRSQLLARLGQLTDEELHVLLAAATAMNADDQEASR